MSNLTLERGVARQLAAAEPVPRHDLVVFDRIGTSGTRYREVVPPDGQFRRPWHEKLLRKKNTHLAVLVSRHPSLDHVFTCECVSHDQLGPLKVEIFLEFRVQESQTVAEGLLAGDPLQRLQTRLKELVARTVGRHAWKPLEEGQVDLEEEFRQVTSLDESGHQTTHYDLARRFAAGLGLEIGTVHLKALLPKGILEQRQEILDIVHEKHLEREKARLEAELAEYKDQHAKDAEERALILDYVRERRKTMKAQVELTHGVIGRAVNALGTAMDNAAGNVDTVTELKRAVQELLSLQKEMKSQIHLQDEDQDAIQVTARATPLLETGNGQDPLANGKDPLAKWLRRTLELSAEMPCEEADRRRLRSAALHVLAEAYLGHKADNSRLKEYAARVKEEHVALNEARSVQTNDHREFLLELRNVRKIKQLLS